MLRVLIDIGHPKQVHQFKYTYWELEKKGWECLFVSKDKEITIDLLKKYKLKYFCLGKTKTKIISKIFNMPIFAYRFYKIVKKFNPDIILSRFSAHSAHVAKLLKIPHIGFSDTEHATLLDYITVPFVDIKLTSTSYKKDLGKNHFRYNGNIELAYLHPNWFTPDNSIFEYLKLDKGEKYIIIRFVSWTAYHDIGEVGFSVEKKVEAVSEFSKYARIFISSEGELPEELKKYTIKIPMDKMHDALAYASLYIGESPTMTSEAGILGTPAICVSSWACDCGNFEDLKSYDLIKCFRPIDEEKALQTALNILRDPDSKNNWLLKSKKFISEKIDVTRYMKWVIVNYPNSIETLKKCENFSDKFK